MKELNTEEFKANFIDDNKIINKTGRPALIDFWAPWCGPCRAIAPMLDKISAICTEVDFYRLNVDDEPLIADLLQIRGIPTLIGLSENFNNEGIPAIVGLTSEEKIKEFIHVKVKNCQQ